MDARLLSQSINHELDNLNQRAQRSVVVVHNGRKGAGAGVIWRTMTVTLSPTCTSSPMWCPTGCPTGCPA